MTDETSSRREQRKWRKTIRIQKEKNFSVIIRIGLNLFKKESEKANEMSVLCVVVIDALLKPLK